MTAPAFRLSHRSPLATAFETSHAPMFTETVDTKDLPVVHALVEYQQDPVAFLVRVLGIPEYRIRWSLNIGYEQHQWDGTPDPLIVICEALRDWMDCAVESGTGTGKSFLAAGLILWFIASWYEARVWSFAPKEEQLRAFMWAEIRKMWPRFQQQFPTALLTDLRIRMRGVRDGAWGAQGFAVGGRAGEEVAVNAQGMHAEHMLLVYEELPGIKLAVTEAGENTSTAPHNLRLGLGNPDHQLDSLHLMGHDQFGQQRSGVTSVRISSLDHPNIVSRNPMIVPGAVSLKSIDRRRGKYGEDARLYKSRIRGISPAEAADALIKLEWIQRAQRRWADENEKRILTANGKAKKALGVDVANSEDGDEAAISRWHGAWCGEVPSFPCPDANILGYDVVQEMKRDHILDEHVGVDVVGVGAGTVNEMKRLERYVHALGGKRSKTPQGEMIRLSGEDVGAEEEFTSQRSQWWWRLREDLRNNNIALPPDAELAQDLVTPKWGTKNGVIWVESKEDLKERLPGGRSPNKGDAVVYGNWVRDRTPLVSHVPKKNPTVLDRIKKELEELDRQERESYRPTGREKWGNPLRQ